VAASKNRIEKVLIKVVDDEKDYWRSC
jgi:hypothetical protein